SSVSAAGNRTAFRIQRESSFENAILFTPSKWLRSRRKQGATALFGLLRSMCQKAMAICRERAHRERCSKTSNASRHDELVNSRDHAIATGSCSLQAFFPDQGYRSAAAARPL